MKSRTAAILPAIAGMLVASLATTSAAATFRVTSTADSGDGSLREAILDANGEPGSSIEIAIGAGAQIVVGDALPALTADGTRIEGGGATLRQSEGCERPRGKKGCDGLVVEAADVVVRDLRIAGFTFDGIGVIGGRTSGVALERITAVDNLDDGIGLSAGAGPVTVRNCLLMGNGFRTKGKGLLVFDSSKALLRDSVVIANRDGVTVTHDSEARLENVLVVGNYDKGFGVSAASAEGDGVQVLANGRSGTTLATEPAPNADGLRVGLGGRAELTHSRIAANGDAGVVVLDTSEVRLRDTVVEDNGGDETSVAPSARFSAR